MSQHTHRQGAPDGCPLFVAHTATACGGLLAAAVKRHFGGFAMIRTALGETLPHASTLTGPVVILGGPMGVGDLPQLGWLREELAWIETVLAQDRRILGVCLGAQLIAHALGHRVGPCPNGTMECGYYRVEGAAGGDHNPPEWVYQWHRDAIVPQPTGHPLTELARSAWHEGHAVQAFTHRQAMGVQFHPEIDGATIERWLARDAADLDRPGARPVHTHLSDHAQHGAAMARWVEAVLVQQWLAGL